MKKILDNIRFPEGPAFDHEGDIWIVEKEEGNLICIKADTPYSFHVGGHPNGIAIDRNNLVWFCDSGQNSIRTFDKQNNTTHTIVSTLDQVPLKMPNDLAFDHNNNLVFTCPGDKLDDGTGYICCYNAKRELKIIYTGLYYPNGLAFASDFRTLFVAETGTHDIWKFRWNTDELVLTDPQIWANVGGPIGPDGMAFDKEGNLYVAVYGSGKIKVLDQQGHIGNEIILSGSNPTNCAIDPQGNIGLIVTEAQQGILWQHEVPYKGII